MIRLLGLLTLVLLAGCEGSKPQPPVAISCTGYLQWEAPTLRMDGSELHTEEIAKFTIFVSEAPDPDDMMISLIVDVTDPNIIAWEIIDLGLRQHWFWVTVTDTDELESAPSNVESKDCSE